MKSLSDNSSSIPVPASGSHGELAQIGAERRLGGSGDGGAPRTVIRGESLRVTPSKTSDDIQALETAKPFAAHTDWLNCTFPIQNRPYFLNEFAQQFFVIAGEQFAPITELGKGHNGWKRSFALGETGGILAIGGQNDTVFLSLPGKACTLIPLDGWPALASLLENHYQARITRWDGAVDDFEGHHSVDWAVAQYLDSQFTAGGNKPKCGVAGDWLEPQGAGRTFYVGKRKNGKVIRIYEKGMQLGDPNSPWVRWEVELHNKKRVVPWEVLLIPGKYVAGSYRCTRWVSNESCRIKTIKAAAKIGYNALVNHAKQAYGPLINVMLAQEGSPEKVIEALIRDGVPARLDLPRPPEMQGPLLSDDT